jgi:S-adenosylmethionine-diacylgycerolhomoserine-N-methlytransferase
MHFVNTFTGICKYCVTPKNGLTHAQRMDALYRDRAGDFDATRDRFQPGRKELFEMLPIREGGVWVDLGAGTAANFEFLGDRLSTLAKVYLIEPAASLRAIAYERITRLGWRNAELIDGDALSFDSAIGAADVVTMSYSLAMIVPWLAALEQAERLLRPGGVIGVVEYHASSKHSWLTRRLSIWCHQLWEVFPDPEHLPCLHTRFAVQHFRESAIPTLIPGLQFPYFVFIGTKPLEEQSR